MNWVDYVGYIVNALIIALVGAVVALIRKVFTNEKELAILTEKLKTVDRIEEEIYELRSDIKDILFKLSDR
jgi:hypothetical protein